MDDEIDWIELNDDDPSFQYPSLEEAKKIIDLFERYQTPHWMLETLIKYIVKHTKHSENLSDYQRTDRAIRAIWGQRNKKQRGRARADLDTVYIVYMAQDMIINNTAIEDAAWVAAKHIMGDNANGESIESKKNRLIEKFSPSLVTDDPSDNQTKKVLDEINAQSELHKFVIGKMNTKHLKADRRLIKDWLKRWNAYIDQNKEIPQKAKIISK